jgi:hypothetical protein
MVEGDGTEQVSDGNPQRLCDLAQRVFRQESIALVKRVQHGEQWGRLPAPAVHELLVRRNRHALSRWNVKDATAPAGSRGVSFNS